MRVLQNLQVGSGEPGCEVCSLFLIILIFSFGNNENNREQSCVIIANYPKNWVTPGRAVARQVFGFGQRPRMTGEGDTNAR